MFKPSLQPGPKLLLLPTPDPLPAPLPPALWNRSTTEPNPVLNTSAVWSLSSTFPRTGFRLFFQSLIQTSPECLTFPKGLFLKQAGGRDEQDAARAFKKPPFFPGQYSYFRGLLPALPLVKMPPALQAVRRPRAEGLSWWPSG